jgi:hypothetical protein
MATTMHLNHFEQSLLHILWRVPLFVIGFLIITYIVRTMRVSRNLEWWADDNVEGIVVSGWQYAKSSLVITIMICSTIAFYYSIVAG